MAAFSMANGHKQVVFTNILPCGVFFLLPSEETDSAKLREITNQMEVEFSSASSRTYSPEPGAFCCALSKADGNWYRAIVTEMQDDSHCCVFYPDYGNEEIVPVERMRQREDSFFQYPFLSQACILGDFVPRGNQWTPNLINVFQTMALNKQFYVCYHGFADKVFSPLNTIPHEVSLYQDIQGNYSVTDALIKLGYGFSTIPSLLCPTSVPMECHVCYCQPPLDFWIQLDANVVLMGNLHHQMNQKKHGYQKALPMEARYPGVGCMVLVQENFCRAKIVGINDNANCTVLLVDSGATVSFPIDQLYSLLPEFCHLSAQATRCTLHGVVLPETSQKVSALFNRFKQLVTGAGFTANFFMKTSGVYPVALTNVTGGVPISDQLMSEGLVFSKDGAVSQVSNIILDCGDKENVLVTAVETPSKMWGQLIRNTDAVDALMEQLYTTYSTTAPGMIKIAKGNVVAAQYTLDDGWYRAVIKDVDSAENCVEVFYIDYGNGETISSSRLRELRPEFLKLPAQAVNFSLYGVDVKLLTDVTILESLVVNKVLEMSVVETDSSTGSPMVKLVDRMRGNFDIIQLLDLKGSAVLNPKSAAAIQSGYKSLHPTVGNRMVVQITYANSPVDFYCQQLEQGDQFDQLLSDINDYCESGSAVPVTMPTVGEAVLAQYDMDMVWYRGEVVELTGDTCKLLFVDYGNVEQVSKQKIYTMMTHFLQLPAQAIHCSLEGISPNVTQDQVDAFESLVQQSLLCTIDSLQQGVYYVTLALSDGTPVVIPSGAVVEPATVQYGVPIPVYVSFCEGPGSFWCQEQDRESQLQKLSTQLNKFYESQPAKEQQLYMLYVGMLCCARYSSDGNWYRAQVSEVRGNAVTVYFFDYGNYEDYVDLPLPDVKQLDDRFLSIPAFATHCKLAGINEQISAAADRFEELVMSDVMVAQFVSEGDGGIVETELMESGPNGAKTLDLLQNYISTNQQSIPSLALPMGTSVAVLVTAFASNSAFYCQLLANDSHLTKFMHDLDSFYSPLNPMDMSCDHLTTGSYACGQFTENDCWYRIIVQDVKSISEVSVMYIDYGNQEVLPLARIKQLAPRFMSYPLQAVKCSLIGTNDTNVDENFADLLLNKEFHLTAKQAISDGSYCVSLVGIDGIEVLKEAEKHGMLVKKPVSGVGLHLSSVSSQLEIGSLVDVMVTHVESPSHFYCNLLKFNDDLAAVTDIIATRGVLASPLSHPEAGMYCLARYSVDEEWYRAHVISVNNSKITVQFVDYGNVDSVAVSDLKRLEDQQLYTTAKQAIKCGLAHMRPFRGSQWSAGSCEFLTDAILDQTLVAQIQELTPDHVELGLCTADNTDISAQLTAAGHAIKQSQTSLNYKELPLFPSVVYSLYVCHVEPPPSSTVWCQLSSCVNELNMLMDQLVTYCATAKPITAGQVYLGMACCVLYEDGGWYRGLVTNDAPGSKFEILLVDFGNLIVVKASEMREIRGNQLVLPKQAFCCSLDVSLALDYDSETLCALKSRNADGVWNLGLCEGNQSSVNTEQRQEKLITILKDNPFKKARMVDVFVSYVVSPAQFYCQVLSYYEQLTQLSTRMQSFGFSSMATPSLQEGLFCAARYTEDNLWYRAKITSIDSSTFVRVLFVDYGNTERVNSNDIKTLPELFTQLSAQAICCSLPTELAVSVNQDDFANTVFEQQFKLTLVEILPDQAYAVTLTTTSDETLFTPFKPIRIPLIVLSAGTVEVAYVSHVESPVHFYCQLHRNVADLTSMQDTLADSCFKKRCIPHPASKGMFYAARYSVDEQWYRAEVISVHGQQALVRFCDYGNTDTIDVSKNMVVLDEKFSSLPAQGVFCSLGDSPRLSTAQLTDLIDNEITISVQSATRDGLHVVQIKADNLADQSLKVPPLGLSTSDCLPVVVTNCVSPQSFCCQDQRAASQLEQVLSSLCDLENGTVPSELSVGQHCAARFSEDGQWYRAEVKTIAKPQECTVFFLDYGNEDVVSVDALRCLTPQLCQLPAQAFHCAVFKSLPAKSMDPDTFYSKVADQEFTARIVSMTSDNAAYVVKLETESGEIIDDATLNSAHSESQQPLSIPRLDVSLNVPIEVCVVYVAGPSEIFCHLTENLEVLEEMMAQLELTSPGHVTSPDTNSYYAAKYSEYEAWYRAKVLETHDSSMVSVKFIDYGNIEAVDISEMAPLNPQLCSVPVQAVECSLKKDAIANINDINAFDVSWVENTTSAIFSVGTHSDVLDVILLDSDGNDIAKSFSAAEATTTTTTADDVGVVYTILPTRAPLMSGTSVSVLVTYTESADVFYCHLEAWLNEVQQVQCVLEEYCEKAELLSGQSMQPGNYVVAEYSEDGQWYRAKILAVESDCTATVYFLDYGNKETVDKMVSMPSSLLSTPPLAIECHLKSTVELSQEDLVLDILDVLPNNQYIVQPRTGKGDQGTPQHAALPTNAVGPSRPFSTENLTIGVPCEVIVSHAEGPTMFFVQKSENASQLNEIMEKMSECYNTTSVAVVPSKGMMCGALFGDDGTWYRARVISLSGENVTLFYVDFGNTDIVSLSEIQPINDEYCALPAQAIKCATTVTTDDEEFAETVLNMECVVTATKITAGNTHLVGITTMEGEPLLGLPSAASAIPIESTDNVAISTTANFIESESLAVSSRVPMFVTHVDSPLSFWCRPLSSFEQLDTIMTVMSDFYAEHVMPAPSVTTGTIIAAQYSEDELWYRAKVLNVSDEGVSAQFVDYGNSEVVSMDRIRPIDDQFLSLSAQAIHCSISGDTCRTCSQDVITSFTETVLEQEVNIVVQDVRDIGLHIVQLETASGELLDHLFTPTPDNEDASLEDVPSNGTIPVDYQYPTIQLDEGNEVDVYISYVEGPANFYCQPLNLAGDLESMMQELEKAMQKPRPLPAAPIGQVCAACFSQDGLWYRAVVMVSDHDVDNDEIVTVNFVDYGNSEATTVKNLACLPKEFLVLSAQAIRCSCVDSGTEKFPDHVVQQFHELICEGEQYTITVEQLLGYGKYYVLVSNQDGEVNVTELLQDAAIVTTETISALSPTAASEDRHVVAMTAEEAQEEEMVNRLLKLPILQHQQVGPENVKESSLAASEVPFQLSLTPHEVFLGTISHVENPSLFYVQRCDCASELVALGTDIEEHCQSNPTFRREAWSAGSFVLAMSNGDVCQWRRAEVKETYLDGNCEIFFVDYGTTSFLLIDSLRACPESCVALPMQAIACSLAHVPRREEAWPAYYKELMEEFALNKELRISVAVPGTQGMRPAVVVEATGSGAELSQKVSEKLQAECEGGSTSLSLAEGDNDYLEPLPLDGVPANAELEDEDQDLEDIQDWLCHPIDEFNTIELNVKQIITFSYLHGETPDNLIGYLYSVKWEGLMQQIASYASSCTQIEDIDDIIPRRPIIAHHDNTWYRAHVTSIQHSSKSLTVFLPDNLNTVEVPLSDVRPMKSEFMNLSIRAVECALVGVEPLQYEWGKDYGNVLRVLTHLKQPLRYEVVSVQPTKVIALLEDEGVWTEIFIKCCLSRVLAELEPSSVLLEHEQ